MVNTPVMFDLTQTQRATTVAEDERLDRFTNGFAVAGCSRGHILIFLQSRWLTCHQRLINGIARIRCGSRDIHSPRRAIAGRVKPAESGAAPARKPLRLVPRSGVASCAKITVFIFIRLHGNHRNIAAEGLAVTRSGVEIALGQPP